LSLIQQCLQVVRHTLREAKAEPSEVTHIVLAGRPSRMPAIRDALRSLLPTAKIYSEQHESAVATGCAIMASVRFGGAVDVLLLDVTPFSVGIEVSHGIFHCVIPRNTPLPARRVEQFTTGTDFITEIPILIY
jgi:molecular chaperone DnaK (HSP70)